MDAMNPQSISDFLSEAEPYIEKLDSLSLGTAAELYDMLDEAARAATSCICEIDPELRVKICDFLDMVLERIVDELPPFEHEGEPLKIYTPALNVLGFTRWENVYLMKDCGLISYMLAKELGASPVMFFGTKPSDFPYLSSMPGMEMLYHDSDFGLEDAYKDYLLNNYPEMDILVIHGMFNISASYLDVYRKLRADGKVYCALDMSSWMMNEISWNAQGVDQFSSQCDIISTSCRQIRNELNRNPEVHFPCRWLPNGFYNPTDTPVMADRCLKENVLLTVGRIGSKEKNNEELLEAFARVSDTIEGWSLRLVGPIEPKFKPYIDEFFTYYPHLRERVIFTGAITDKEELYKEYARAKIFALTSFSEGGTPNVYAESLFHGCMFVTSNIDAADDITNHGELGVKYPPGDVGALQKALVETCIKADKQGMQQHIPKALAYAKKYYDWNRNAKKLAYMLFK